MFIRKYWLPLTVFVVLICGVSLYMLTTQTPKEPIKIYKPVEPLEKPTAEAPVEDTSQGGHRHADGTWHDAPRDTPVGDFSDPALADIPEDMPKPDIPLPSNLKNMDLQEWEQWQKKHDAEWQKYVHALNPAIERLGKEVDRLRAAMPPEDSPDYAAAEAKYSRVMLEYDRRITEKGWRIHEANAAMVSASDAHSLARYGKK